MPDAVRDRMRMLLAGSAGLAAFAVLAALASPASAETITIGADTGITRADADRDAATSVGLFARLPVRERVGIQLDVARIVHGERPSIMAPPGEADILAGTGYVVVDLDAGTLVPIALVGAGMDRATTIVRDVLFARAEVGVGLELRARSFTLGADARLGMRESVAQTRRDILALYEPRTLSEGSFKGARVTLGLRF